MVVCSPAVYFTVGGSLTGLNSGGQITLKMDSGPDEVTGELTLTANGAFTFPTTIRGGVSGYSVTVPTQPTGLLCTVSNGSGYPITADVVNVSVTCVLAAYYTVGGTLSGLGSGGGITLENHDSVSGTTDMLTLTANGTFTFPTSIRGGSGGYDVTVDAQPTEQHCTVSNGEAQPITANVSNVSVTCTDVLGGTLTGLDSGEQVTLLDNVGDSLVLKSNGTFAFPTMLADGQRYDVTVGSHPAGEMCSVTGGSGSASGPVGSVQVACVNVERILYTFDGGSLGTYPQGSLVMDGSGNLYGTASGGGAGGTVFKLAPNGSGGYSASLLYAFAGGYDGSFPDDNVIMDSAGNLYGTTSGGSWGINNGWSTVFKLAPNGGGYGESVLHLFTGTPDGQAAQAGLIMDGAGNLYGTTPHGGNSGGGTVFKLAPNGSGGYTESIVYSFDQSPGGGEPVGGLIMDGSGNFYGTTFYGGSAGYGTVFELTPDGSGGYTESVLYSFTGFSDGAYPTSTLVMDGAGNLYGTTSFYDSANSPSPGSSLGTVFRLTPNGSGGYNKSTLYTFTGGSNGRDPYGSLIMDSSGNLYGTTVSGGDGNGNGDGTVFKLAPNGSGGYTESIVYSFVGGTDGDSPYDGLLMDSAGNLYGTGFGGIDGYGVVFEIPAQ